MPRSASLSSMPAAPAPQHSAITRSSSSWRALSSTSPASTRSSRHRKSCSLFGSLLKLLFSSSLLLTSSGCYYGHLAIGQAKLLLARQSVENLLADPETYPELRAKLELVSEAREFASELGLEVGNQYTSYVPWPEDRIITSIIATRPGEIDAAGFHFPILGSVPYKGFFDLARAEREAEKLRAEGMDVCIGGVTAYSTLGWFDDPLTSPMLNAKSDDIVETVIHELVHATVFLKSQPDFNEGVANFIGEEAVVLFYSDPDRTPPPERDPRRRIDDGRLISQTLMTIREDVAALYARSLGDEERRRERRAIDDLARDRLRNLDLSSRDPARLAERARLNDACRAIQSTYVADTPLHGKLLSEMDDDLVRFILRLREVDGSEDPRASFFGL